MTRSNNPIQRKHQRTLGSLLLIGVLILGGTAGFSRGPRPETIEATALAAATRAGEVFGVTLNIYDFSTPADKQILPQAFEKAQKQG